MEKLIPLLMCIIFIAIAFCLWKAAIKISSFAARRKVLSYSRASASAVSVLLISYFGDSAVLPNVYLPCRTTKGVVYTDIDDIIVLPTCIVVVEVKSMNGQIFTGKGDKWHQSLKGKNGETTELDFENPILKNERNTQILTAILEKEKLPIPPIHNIVMFSTDKVVFSEEFSEVYKLSAAIEKIKMLSKGKRFSRKEQRRYIKTINKYSTSAAEARAHNAKIRKKTEKNTK